MQVGSWIGPQHWQYLLKACIQGHAITSWQRKGPMQEKGTARTGVALLGENIWSVMACGQCKG